MLLLLLSTPLLSPPFHIKRTRPLIRTLFLAHAFIRLHAQFRENVLKLLPGGEPRAVDVIFDSLDADGGGSLNIAEVRKALKRFQEESTSQRDQLRASGIDLITKFKACRRAQAEYKAQATVEAAEEQVTA